MSIILKQYNDMTITPTDDSILYDHFLSETSGIISGCTVTNPSTNNLVIAAGRGVIRGRSFQVTETNVTATLSPSGEVNGRLLIQIDMNNTDTPISFITQAATTLPELIQQDINNGGSIYQLPIATYKVNISACSDLQQVANILPSPVVSSLAKRIVSGDTDLVNGVTPLETGYLYFYI